MTFKPHNMIIEVFYEDTDAAGFVYYANYLKYFERARMKFFEREGVSVRYWADKGKVFVVNHAEINYKSPAYLGEKLNLVTEITRFTRVRILFTHTISVDKRVVVTGTTSIACLDDKGKISKIDIEKLRCSPEKPA